MSRTHGSEPYSVRLVERWLVGTYRPTLLPQSDGIFHAYELADGRRVVVPGPSARNRPIATGTAHKVAADLGLSFEEFRESIGFPIVKHSKPVRKAVRDERRTATRRDVIGAAAEIRAALARLEGAIKQGQRDSTFYLELHGHLVRALRATKDAITEANRTGARNV
ncbi:MAG: hypothetical protein M3548_09155 [Actinomycetota bacterium]|nr:hypothetical protein [Actinomycetota bacterium]